MSKILLIIVVFSFIIGNGCTKEYTKRCNEYLEDESKHGYSFTKGSYKDFGEFASFNHTYRKKIVPADTTDNIVMGISLFELDDNCIQKDLLGLKYLPMISKDTILINYSYLGLSNEFAGASFLILDDDALIEQYDILESKGLKNWVFVDYISPDTTYIEGRFNLSFVTTYEPYLTGERERWDDPNRPDTLHFTNGEFRAVLEKID